jgi:hypothetical protein
MPTKRVDRTVLPDGTIEVHTPDEGQPHYAESRARTNVDLQAALEVLRAGGVSRPVKFQLGNDDRKSIAEWKLLLPALRTHGTAVWNADAMLADRDDEYGYVLRTDRAREVLRDVLQVAGAARLFRTPSWPIGYWTVSLQSGDVVFQESRTFKDMANTGTAAS